MKNTATVEEIKQYITVNPLKAIDSLLEVITKDKQGNSFSTTELLHLFCQAILISQSVDEYLWKNDPKAGIFHRETSQNTRHFIGVCLLRLLSSNSSYFSDEQFHLKVFNLFNDVFSNDIYVLYKVNKSDQTFIKERMLKDVVPAIEREISDTISSLKSLDMLLTQTFRRSFMDMMMNKKAQVVIWPFLPQNSQALTLKLNDVFALTEHYLKGPEMMTLQAFEKAQSALSTYVQEVEQYGTRYSIEYLGNITRKLLDLLQRDFESNPISKPASLSIAMLEKKYPISIKGRTFDLGITITNEGPGHAFNTILEVLDADLLLKKSEIYIGSLNPTSTIIDIPATVDKPMQSMANIMGELRWTNFDDTKGKIDFFLSLDGQRTDIDWDSLKEDNPYDLEPVATEDELVGRAEILNNLIAQSKAKSVGSSYIYGQKRVGKTSIVKTLKTRIASSHLTSYLVVYLEMGDYIDPDAKTTIRQLGKRLCREIRRANPIFSHLPIPEFESALSPLSDFLESVLDVDPSHKILFILDEFDELPRELYLRASLGDALFLTLRSLILQPHLCGRMRGKQATGGRDGRVPLTRRSAQMGGSFGRSTRPFSSLL